MVRGARSAKVAKVVRYVPLALVVAISCFGLWCVLLLLAQRFTTALVWIPGLVILLGSGVGSYIALAHRAPDETAHWQLGWDSAIIVFVLLWCGFNMLFASQHVLTNRDPATYTNAASWLARHDSILIPTSAILEENGNLSQNSAGFDVGISKLSETPIIFAQGEHVVPALLGAVGKFVGPTMILRFNVLLGGLALLMLYTLARLFVKSYWAAIATGIFAASYPLIYFSRDIYTEPLTAASVLGGLALVTLAYRRRQTLLWLLAGLVFGVGLLARIDTYLGIIGIAAFLVWYMMFADTKVRRERVIASISFMVPVIVCGIVSWGDLYFLSFIYWLGQEELIVLEELALAFVIVAGAAMTFLAYRKPAFAKWLMRITRWKTSIWVVVAFVAVGLLFASRPLWYQVVHSTTSTGAPSFAEYTTYWVSWYVGGGIAVAGLLGAAMCLYHNVRSKALDMLPILLAFGATTAVYLSFPSIAADQPWASRRMLPLIMPVLILFGVYFIENAIKLVRYPIKQKLPRWSSEVLIGVALLITPLVVSRPLVAHAAAKQGAFVNICTKLQKNSVVVWVGDAWRLAPQPTQTYCGVPSYSFATGEPTIQQWRAMAHDAKQAGKTLVVGVFSSTPYGQQGLATMTERQVETLKPVAEIDYENPNLSVLSAPSGEASSRIQISIAQVSTEGLFETLSVK